MNIKNFETGITNVILKRGRDYFRREHVVNLFEKTEMNWQAEVEGTYIYTVDIELSEIGDVLGSTCNCPYDWERYCKHEAAVFFALQEVIKGQDIKGPKKETKTLKQLLQTKSKEQLIQLILDMSSNDSRLYNELSLEMIQPENEIKSAEEVILYHIEKVKNNGFINDNNVSKALEGVYITLERVKGMLEESQYEQVINLGLVSLKHTVDVFNYADHASGDIGQVMECSLTYTEEAAKEGVKNWSRKEKSTIFSKILQEAIDKQFDGWTDWRFRLLTTCVHFCTEAKIKNELNKVLESLLRQVGSESWNDKYNQEKLKAIQLKIISQSKDTSAIEEFLLDNLANSNIRDKAILYSLDKREFQQMLQLKIDREI